VIGLTTLVYGLVAELHSAKLASRHVLCVDSRLSGKPNEPCVSTPRSVSLEERDLTSVRADRRVLVPRICKTVVARNGFDRARVSRGRGTERYCSIHIQSTWGGASAPYLSDDDYAELGALV